ncbi:MAG: hypothetical protein KC443_13630, partial [Anaerolineales bacterium]|nr:hypothetical protein [Anaerolineales bacterium]
AVDLEAKLNELCARLADINCPDNLQVNVALSTNPASVFESNQLPSNLTITVPRMRTLGWYSFPARLGEHTLTLPTPTLLGLPLDETGYQAVYRGYAARVVSAVIAEQVGWQCCEGGLLFQALLDEQLAQLGLKPWPVTPAAYEAMLGMPVTAVYQTWRDAELGFRDDQLPLYVMVDFLAQDVGVSAVTMQSALVEASAEEWLPRVVEDVYPSREDLERGWRHYLYGRSQAAQTPVPIPWPQQELLLVCRPLDFTNALLYHYAPAADELTVARALGQETAVLLPIPNTTTVFVGEQGKGAFPFASTFLWEPSGQETLIDRQSATGGVVALPLAASPDGKLATLFAAGRNVIPYVLLDLDACQTGGHCELQPLLGRPIWSSDGLQTLLVGNAAGGNDDTLLFVGDALGQNVELIGEGQYPFWLDHETAVYVSAQQVTAVHTADLSTETLFSLDETLAGLAAQTADWQLDFVGTSPQTPDVWLLALVDGEGMAHLLTYDGARDLVTERSSWVREKDAAFVQYQFSPDGRWLAVASLSSSGAEWQLFLYDVVQNVMHTYALGTAVPGEMSTWLDWSADRQWAVITHDGYVRLLAPAADYERWFIPDRMACDQAIWDAVDTAPDVNDS